MRLIETTDLKNWAGSKPAESRFPYIVKSLICAVIQPDKLRMPSGDAVWVPGFDGELSNSEVNRFVPEGLSVWELGTSEKYKSKADKDYEKRSTDNPDDSDDSKSKVVYDRSTITFVFVTPFVWKDKEEWIAKRKAENIWKDVRVIDGVDLQDWLEAAPSVSLKFAAEIGRVPEEGLYIPDQAWEEWSYLTDPPVSEELLVAGRSEQVQEILTRLVSPPSAFIVRGDSPREAWGFVLATLRRMSSVEEQFNIYARTIVADNEEVAGRLRNLNNLVIVLKQARGQVSSYLSSRGCHLIIPEGNDASSERNVIILSRPSFHAFSKALETMNLKDEEAERIARTCGRSITILQRQQACANFELPSWLSDDHIGHLIPALLAGRWNSQNKMDKEILCQLAEEDDYEKIKKHLQPFLSVAESPLLKIENMWTITAPVDAFQLLANRSTKLDLDRFKNVFRQIFSTVDPKVEIKPDDWMYYALEKEQTYSEWLRCGMAETLLLIAERGTDAQLDCVSSTKSYVEEVVGGIPGLEDDWRILASLRDQYPRLVEAAPDPFLSSLEQMLEAKPDDVCRIFVEPEGFGGGVMHTGLLWGLEALAWSPEFLPRVSLILAKLASIDPGGRWMNRPINSLCEIFLWWHPGTNAPFKQRIDAIDNIIENEPGIGWSLIARLLPSQRSSVSHMTARPRWRDVGDLPEEAMNRLSQIRYISSIIDRVLDNVGRDPERWRAVLDSLSALNSSHREKVMSMLNAIAEDSARDDLKYEFWEMLRSFVYQHRTFQDANWALPEELIESLESALRRLAPDDPVERSRWLFDEWLPDLPSHEESVEKRQEQINSNRQQAIREVLEVHGTEGIIKLGLSCKYPGFVASVAVPLLDDVDSILVAVNQAIAAGDEGIELAGQISGKAREIHGDEWSDLILTEANSGTWTTNVIAFLIIWWPDNKSTWDIVASLGQEVDTEYWRRKQVFLIKGSQEEQVFQIKHLIEVGRAAVAFDRVALHLEEIPSEILLMLFDAAFKELNEAKTVQEVRRLGLTVHDVDHFLGQLRHRDDIPREEIARREYQALPLLGSLHAENLTIHCFMAEDPQFFIDIICDIYLPTNRDKDEDIEITDKIKARAEAGFTLLESMRRIPGLDEEGLINEEVLKNWIESAKEKAKEADRAIIADVKMGQILSHSPIDPEDGGWPHKAVRNVIEKFAADNVEEGFITGCFNKRGVYTKSLFEGGTQERDLARQYREWAELSNERWPRMASVLNKIAKGWEGHAHMEDIRAEQDKMD